MLGPAAVARTLLVQINRVAIEDGKIEGERPRLHPLQQAAKHTEPLRRPYAFLQVFQHGMIEASGGNEADVAQVTRLGCGRKAVDLPRAHEVGFFPFDPQTKVVWSRWPERSKPQMNRMVGRLRFIDERLLVRVVRVRQGRQVLRNSDPSREFTADLRLLVLVKVGLRERARNRLLQLRSAVLNSDPARLSPIISVGVVLAEQRLRRLAEQVTVNHSRARPHLAHLRAHTGKRGAADFRQRLSPPGLLGPPRAPERDQAGHQHHGQNKKFSCRAPTDRSQSHHRASTFPEAPLGVKESANLSDKKRCKGK